MKFRSKVVFTFLTIMATISFSTSPKAPPYYQYRVNGTIECDSLESFSNYTIALFGGWKDNNPEYIRLDWPEESQGDYGVNLAVTDSLGAFYLRTSYPILFDSLKLGLVQPGGINLFSSAIFVDTLQLKSEWKDYWYENESGCSSCSVQPQSDMIKKSEIVYYYLRVNDVVLSLCD